MELVNRGLLIELFGNLMYVVMYVFWVCVVCVFIVVLDD